MTALRAMQNAAEKLNAAATGTIAAGGGQQLASPAEEARPEEWWKRVPPERRDWWTRQLNRMPHASGNFRDDIVKKPPARGTETLGFDRNTFHPDLLEIVKERRKRFTPAEVRDAMRKADDRLKAGEISRKEHRAFRQLLDEILGDVEAEA